MSPRTPKRSAGKLSQTCDTCKYRHQKCSGTRPTCQHCALRGIECKYSNTKAHKIDISGVRRNTLATNLHANATQSSSGPVHDDTESPARATPDYLIVYDIMLAGLVTISCLLPGPPVINSHFRMIWIYRLHDGWSSATVSANKSSRGLNRQSSILRSHGHLLRMMVCTPILQQLNILWKHYAGFGPLTLTRGLPPHQNPVVLIQAAGLETCPPESERVYRLKQKSRTWYLHISRAWHGYRIFMRDRTNCSGSVHQMKVFVSWRLSMVRDRQSGRSTSV
jgi:hypothetical protein